MRFEGKVYRPPAEGDSLLLQLTVGCSHNRCAFCPMYREKRYRVRDLDDVFEDLDEAARWALETRRVFVCDGDALSAGFDAFAAVCERLNERFPKLRRVAAYVNVGDILRLSGDELAALRRLKFTLGYLGLESGSDEVLRLIRKGATAADMLAAARRAREAELKLSVIALLGAGGRALSAAHAAATVAILNEMRPPLLSLLTTIIRPRTPMYAWVKRGEFEPLTERETLVELRRMLDGLDLPSTVFRANHRSNLVGLEGRLPKDKARLLAQVDGALASAPDEVTCVWPEEEGAFL